MRRGEIVSVNFDPAQGSEANKTRPAVVVSNDAANATATRLGRGVITVVPVTSNVSRVYPFQLLLPADLTGLPRDSKAQAEQIRSVPVDRVGAVIGRLPPSLVSELDRALRVQLSLLFGTRRRRTRARGRRRRRLRPDRGRPAGARPRRRP